METGRLAELVRLVAELTARLREMAERPENRVGTPEAALARAQAILSLRRRRDALFDPRIFGEPAWDILLDLFVESELGRRVPVSSACIASAAPATTALRHIAQIEERGLIFRTPDAHDRRKSMLSLSPKTREYLLKLLS